jgi:hypothetical protein
LPKFNEAQGAWEPEEHEIDRAAEQASLLRAFGKAPAQPAPQPNPILFHPDLVDREFGSHLIAVSKLTDWAAKRGLEVDTQPPIGGFQFVQVEAFLCAIERAARESTRDEQQAAAIIQATPHLAHDRAAEVAPRWLVGADAHMQWRRLLERAVEAGELVLLHFGSKLPIEAPTEPQTAPEVKEKPQDRRARWLVMFEEEEARAPRGALQRLADREGVDRSNMKKDIDKARAARDTERRAGGWASQLVQDGKRAR